MLVRGNTTNNSKKKAQLMATRKKIVRTFVKSLVNTVVYEDKHMLILLNNGEMLEYSGVPRKVVQDLLKTEARGVYYNEYIAGRYNEKKLGATN